MKAARILKLSATLRRHVAQLAEDIPAQVTRMMAAEREAIGDYARVHDRALLQDVKQVCAVHADVWYQAILQGRPPLAAQLEPFADMGRRRQRQGFQLINVLQAVRLAAMTLWNTLLERTRKLPDVRDELLFQLSPYLLQHFELISQAVTRGYVEEGQQRRAEHALDDALRESRSAMLYLSTLVERLEREPPLLDTLHAYFQHRQRRKPCAAALGIHINTLSHRLDRIEALLGARLDDPAWIARLHAALRLANP